MNIEAKYVYVMIAYGGSYEDAWRSNRLASLDKSALEAVANVKNEEIRVLTEKQERVREHMQVWAKKNPTPPHPGEVYVDKLTVPTWVHLKEKEITAEMRAERALLKEENQRRQTAAYEIAYRPQTEWRAIYDAEQARFITEEGLPADIMSVKNETDGYEVKAVEFMS